MERWAKPGWWRPPRATPPRPWPRRWRPASSTGPSPRRSYPTYGGTRRRASDRRGGSDGPGLPPTYAPQRRGAATSYIQRGWIQPQARSALLRLPGCWSARSRGSRSVAPCSSATTTTARISWGYCSSPVCTFGFAPSSFVPAEIVCLSIFALLRRTLAQSAGRHMPERTLCSDRCRSGAVQRYRAWSVSQPQLLARLPELRGKALDCWLLLA